MKIVRNALANLSGGLLPAVVMVVTTPIMVARLGLADYGLLTIISAIAGYFSIIDINLTAGSLKYVSHYRALGDTRRESQTVVLGLLVYLAIAVVGALAIWFFAERLIGPVFDIAAEQRASAHEAFRFAAVIFALGQVQAYLNSLPQAVQRFNVSAGLEAAFGTAMPIACVLVVLAGGGLVAVLEVRAVSSLLHAAMLLRACRPLFPAFVWSVPERSLFRSVMSFSGYAYLGKVASLSYAHADRLIVGGLLGLEAVTIYSVPATVISRCLGMSFRLSHVVFPEASRLAALNRWDELKSVYMDGARYINYLNACVTVVMLVLGRELLHYWIGGEVASRGYWVFALIALAMFADSLTNLPSLVNDGLGFARTSGRFAICRAIVGLVACWGFAEGGAGIVGVALGHLLASVALATAFLCVVHRRNLPYALDAFLRHGVGWPLCMVLAASLWAALRPVEPLTLLASAAVAGVLGALFAAVGWRLILDPGHRRRVLSWATPS